MTKWNGMQNFRLSYDPPKYLLRVYHCFCGKVYYYKLVWSSNNFYYYVGSELYQYQVRYFIAILHHVLFITITFPKPGCDNLDTPQ